MKFFISAIFLLLCVCATAQIEKDIPAAPNPPKLVNDFTNSLTPAQVQALENKLVAFDDSTSSQIAIVLIPDLKGYTISEWGVELGRKWGIGGKEFNNGILLIASLKEHKVRIEVGYGLEGTLADITAKSIIENSISPNFKEGNYYRGLDLATDDIIKAVSGEYKAPTGYGQKKKKGFGMGSILGLLLLFIILGGMGGGRRGGGGGGVMSGAGWMILGSMLGSSGSRGGGGWSGGGSSGGGFGGFGGGSFGGGGASGSW